jgi:hypothetical protein
LNNLRSLLLREFKNIRKILSDEDCGLELNNEGKGIIG